MAKSGVPQGSHSGPTLYNLVANFASKSLEGVRSSFYADDAKFCISVSKIDDCIKLQTAADKFFSWCSSFGLELNINKCRVMTISRSRSPLTFEYKFNNVNIERVDKFTDLGVIFNNKFNFNDDVAFRVSKGKAMVGLIKRTAPEFKDTKILLTLYQSLVRSNLEYCNQIWAPHYIGKNNDIENVQNKFLRFLAFNENCSKEDIIEKYNICTLKKRRKIASIMFCYDILNGNIDSPGILSLLNFYCPSVQLRRNEIFRISNYSTNYGMFEPVNVMSKNFNSVNHIFDLNVSRSNFKILLNEVL